MVEAKVGDLIAGYRIERELGRGGMSVVYLADHERLERKVALKILAPQLADNQKFRDRFLRESKVAASIDHPNIVPIYDADETGGVLYIAMRYVEGTDLKHLIEEEGTLDAARTVSIIGQLAAALDAAHAKDLIHRDVKPGNVLLVPRPAPDASDHVYLGDFGLTRRSLSISGLTETGQLLGTVDYIAPEQIRGDPLDARADVYALGCVIFECLTGHVPFERENEVAVLWAHVQDPPPKVTDVRPDLPPEVDDVVARAMARDVDDRTETAGQVATELRSALGLAPSGEGERIRRTRRQRRRRRVIVAAVAVLALIAATVVVVGRGRNAPIVPGPDTLALLDTGAARFTRAITVGGGPSGVVFGDGAVWVISERDKTIQRIDPGSGTESTRGTGGTPTGIAWGDGFVWFTNGYGNPEVGGTPIFKVDPTDMTSTPFAEATAAQAIVVARSSIWVTDDIHGQVVAYEALTGGELEGIPLGKDADPKFLAIGSGATEGVWVVNSIAGTVVRIDPETSKVIEPTLKVNAPFAVAADDTGIWVTSETNDTITRFAPDGTTDATLSKSRDPEIPDGPSFLAIAGGSVWVASDRENVLVRIDARTDQVIERIPTAGTISGFAKGDGQDLWVTVRSA